MRHFNTNRLKMKFTIKVWLFTAIVSPLLLLPILGIINSINLSGIHGAWLFIGIVIAYGLFLSMPAMLIFWVLKLKLLNTFTESKTKLILSLYSFVSVWLTFYFFDESFFERDFQQLLWVITYSIIIVIGVWIFKFTDIGKNGA